MNVDIVTVLYLFLQLSTAMCYFTLAYQKFRHPGVIIGPANYMYLLFVFSCGVSHAAHCTMIFDMPAMVSQMYGLRGWALLRMLADLVTTYFSDVAVLIVLSLVQKENQGSRSPYNE